MCTVLPPGHSAWWPSAAGSRAGRGACALELMGPGWPHSAWVGPGGGGGVWPAPGVWRAPQGSQEEGGPYRLGAHYHCHDFLITVQVLFRATVPGAAVATGALTRA